MGSGKKTSRRKFLAAGALLGAWVGLDGARSRAAEAEEVLKGRHPDGLTNFFEPPGLKNKGPTFLRKTFDVPLPTGRIPVLQGATSQTETQFRVLVPANSVARYFISDFGGGPRRSVSPRARNGGPTSQMVVDHIFVDGLLSGGKYWLEIETTGPKAFTERRQFSTLSDRNSGGDPLRVALISCQNDRYVDKQASMWAAVAKASPELLIFNGDSCYVDQRSDGTIEGMWNRHVTTRTMLDVFKWDRLIPILATWDDHDTGDNDSNSSNPFQKVARENFIAMFGSDPVQGIRQSNELCYSFTTHGQRFIFLDCRSGRTGNQVFSSADETWLRDEILTSPGPVWLISGMQFWGGYLMGAESVEKTSPDQLYRIMKVGASASVPMILCSGDVHFSEIMEIESELMGYRTYELTSSAIHSRTFPGQQYRSYNGRRIDSTSRNNFFALETCATSAAALEFEAVSSGADDTEYFRFKASVRR